MKQKMLKHIYKIKTGQKGILLKEKNIQDEILMNGSLHKIYTIIAYTTQECTEKPQEYLTTTKD